MAPVDLAVLVLYIAGCTALGSWLGTRGGGLKGYFLGESSIPGWAVMISIVATETSTATFLSVPSLSFRQGGNFAYLQLALGYLLGRVVVASLLLPAYFEGQMLSAYEVLHRRFGGTIKTTASTLFLISRTLGDGLRLYLAALVLRELTGWPIAGAIAVMGAATIVYTYLGGMRAVIWTDVIQFLVYTLGALIALGFLLGRIDGGWAGLLEAGQAAGKFTLFDFRADPALPFTFWAGLIGGMVLNTATHGADQLMVQRYLAARSRREAARALVTSGFVVLAQFALFLLIGVALFAAYRGTERETIAPDRAFASFVVGDLPANVGLIGVVIAAVFASAMSTLSSSLNASAAATLNDLIVPWLRQPRETTLLRLSKALTILWGIAQMTVALQAARLATTVVEGALTVASFTTGLILGVFLLGRTGPRVGQRQALAGLLAGLITVSYVALGPGLRDAGLGWLYPWPTAIAWPWFALIGSTTVLLTGLVLASLPTRHSVLRP
ncbi:MAG: transporter [Isosphaeraceae bacterium]|jgi:SSS family transporter|nr:MAG: transporter [Isosphaeraceae bacterium]